MINSQPASPGKPVHSEGTIQEGTLVHPGGRPLMFSTPEYLEEQINNFFDYCKDTGELPTITGLAVHLRTNRQTLKNYKEKPEFVDTIKDAMARCEAALESKALLGGVNATMAIFSLKNNYGWVDAQQVDNTLKVVTPIMSLEEQASSETD